MRTSASRPQSRPRRAGCHEEKRAHAPDGPEGVRMNADDGARRLAHNVYVIELDRAVLRDRRFRARNPNYVDGMPCVYVGMTGLAVEERFANHKAGYKSNRYVRKYGLRLLPELYECFNPMPYEAARQMEVELADELQEKGYAVWQG
jgi:predicted GIY-YIG superfamily endonuclease